MVQCPVQFGPIPPLPRCTFFKDAFATRLFQSFDLSAGVLLVNLRDASIAYEHIRCVNTLPIYGERQQDYATRIFLGRTKSPNCFLNERLRNIRSGRPIPHKLLASLLVDSTNPECAGGPLRGYAPEALLEVRPVWPGPS